MRNIGLVIEYDGTNYCGWQTQKSHRVTEFRHTTWRTRHDFWRAPSHQRKSIQEVIEKTLRKILQEKIKLFASGRTDAGVHALAQVANFKTSSNIAPDKLQKALNALLPDDIRVSKAEEKSLDFHSRFHASSKVYRYTILNRSYPSVFLRNAVYFYPHPLDIKLMQKESRVILGQHNFKSFQASDSIKRDSVRIIKKIKINKDNDLIHIDIEADGFLYNMVRSIVGTLIEIARGKFPPGSLKKILKAGKRSLVGPTAPACGLCLLQVKY